MLLLGSLVLLQGCGPTLAVIAVDEMCKSWRYQTVSRNDRLTEETASGIEGSNKARVDWGCHPKEDRKG
jgi:hypothetical protein